MEIKATSVYTLKTVEDTTRVGLFGKADPQKKMRFFSFTVAVLALFYVALAIIYGYELMLWILFEDTVVLVLNGVVVLVYLICVFAYYQLPKLLFKAQDNFAGMVTTYTFTEKEMRIFQNQDSYESQSSWNYGMMFKVIETSAYFYILPTKMDTYPVDKSTLEGGSVEDIRSILMAALGKSYVTHKH